MTADVMTLGEARRRQEAAKKRGEKNQVPADVRAIRAAALAARDEQTAAVQAAVDAERQARPDAVRAILAHASVDELAEFTRVVGQMDGRRLAEIAGEALRQRYLGRILNEEGKPVEAPQSPARGRGRPKATVVA